MKSDTYTLAFTVDNDEDPVYYVGLDIDDVLDLVEGSLDLEDTIHFTVTKE